MTHEGLPRVIICLEAEQPKGCRLRYSMGKLVQERLTERSKVNPDAYLQSLVQWASGEQGDVAITLTVNGVIVTGWVVSEGEYSEGLAKMWEVSSETLEDIMGRHYEATGTPLYFHLRDAQIISGGGETTTVDWWRGRLEMVDGFAIRGLERDTRSEG